MVRVWFSCPQRKQDSFSAVYDSQEDFESDLVTDARPCTACGSSHVWKPTSKSVRIEPLEGPELKLVAKVHEQVAARAAKEMQHVGVPQPESRQPKMRFHKRTFKIGTDSTVEEENEVDDSDSPDGFRLARKAVPTPKTAKGIARRLLDEATPEGVTVPEDRARLFEAHFIAPRVGDEWQISAETIRLWLASFND